MNRKALLYALKAVGLTILISGGGASALTLAIWVPTELLVRYGGLHWLDAYLFGLPTGIGICTLIAIGVMKYREKSREG